MTSKAEVQRLRTRVESHVGTPGECGCAAPYWLTFGDRWVGDGSGTREDPEAVASLFDGRCPTCGESLRVPMYRLDEGDRLL